MKVHAYFILENEPLEYCADTCNTIYIVQDYYITLEETEVKINDLLDYHFKGENLNSRWSTVVVTVDNVIKSVSKDRNLIRLVNPYVYTGKPTLEI